MKRRDSVEDALNQTEELLSQQSSGVSVGSMEIGTWLTRLGLEECVECLARFPCHGRRVLGWPSATRGVRCIA